MSAAENPPRANHEDWTPRVNPWLIALSVMLATFMEVLDTSIASVSLPHIAGNLGATKQEATWVLTSYLVANAVMLPSSAWFARYFGRKRFLLICIAIFTGASFLCGAATSLPLLVVARVLQGAGGGALQPLAQAILLESFPPNRRGVAMAVYGIGVVCAPILGPTLGGWLTDNYSWRWAFYINLPVGLVAAVMISALVDDPPYLRGVRPKRIDALGFGLLALWLCTLQIVLDKGQEEDWFAANWICWFTLISGGSLVALIFWELHVPDPIVNLRVLMNRNFAVGCGLLAIFAAGLYALIALQPLFLQTLMGYTALNAGLTVSPRGIGAVVAMMLVGALVTRINPRFMVAFGFLTFGLSSYLLSRIDLDVARSTIIWPNVLNGFGTAFVFVPLSTIAVGTLPREQIGNGTALQNLLRNLGGSIGISYVSTMLERLAQVHQNLMAQHLTPLQPAYQHRFGALERVFSFHASPIDAAHQAQAALYAFLQQQASLWAFINLFQRIALIGLVCAGISILLKSVKRTGPAMVH